MKYKIIQMFQEVEDMGYIEDDLIKALDQYKDEIIKGIVFKILEYRRTRLYDEVLEAIDDILIKIDEEDSGYDQMMKRNERVGEQIQQWTDKAWRDHNGI